MILDDEQDEPVGKRRRLKDLRVNRIALVDKGANPGAVITLFKRDEPAPVIKWGPRTQAALDRFDATMAYYDARQAEVSKRAGAALGKENGVAHEHRKLFARMVKEAAQKGFGEQAQALRSGIHKAYGPDASPTAKEIANARDSDVSDRYTKADIEHIVGQVAPKHWPNWATEIHKLAAEDPDVNAEPSEPAAKMAADFANLAFEDRVGELVAKCKGAVPREKLGADFLDTEEGRALYHITADPRAETMTPDQYADHITRKLLREDLKMSEVLRLQKVLKIARGFA